MQFDTTINRWHTASNTGRINGMQPLLASTCTSTTRRATWRAQPVEVLRRRRHASTSKPSSPRSRSCSPRRRSSSATPTTRPRRSPRTRRKFRQLGLGYANLGALLMAQGMPYDSDDGRAWAAAITALDDRSRLRHQRPDRGAHGSVRRLHRERASRCSTCCACTAPRSAKIDEEHRAAGAARAPRSGVGRGGRARRDVRRAQLAGDGARSDRLSRRRDARPDRARPGSPAVARRPDGHAVAGPRHRRADR